MARIRFTDMTTGEFVAYQAGQCEGMAEQWRSCAKIDDEKGDHGLAENARENATECQARADRLWNELRELKGYEPAQEGA
jgi:hypothetical protein